MDNQEQKSIRAEIYLILSGLFHAAPSQEMIAFLTCLEIESAESEMQQAWLDLSNAAQNVNTEALEEEYQNLFIGIGRGEVIPFASWHISGSLMDKPLAEIRQDLALLGIERNDEVKEPEDHISALCDVMSMLTGEDESIQQAIFNKHIAPWFTSFTTQIENAPSANFYLSVANLCNTFFSLEKVRFSEKSQYIKPTMAINVKNIVEF